MQNVPEDVQELAENAGFTVHEGTFASWMEQEEKSLHINLSGSEEARIERLEAMTHGIPVFTEEETVRAFLQSGSGHPQPVSLKDLYKKEVASCTQ
ncbi:Carbamoyl-phosphate synthase (glutamine-hydrolyzing) [Bacillus subtilis]|nr:Carbamoyl-phosphate synthase (glutamine-hydrolyzing) [Bacillus subtilis]